MPLRAGFVLCRVFVYIYSTMRTLYIHCARYNITVCIVCCHHELQCNIQHTHIYIYIYINYYDNVALMYDVVFVFVDG